MNLPRPTFQVVQLEKIYDCDGKAILADYTNALLLKLIRMKAFPTLNQEKPYPEQYLKEIEGFLLVRDVQHYLINPDEYEGQELVCLITFEEKLDVLQRSKYRDLLRSLFCLQPQTLQAEEENNKTWKKILAKNPCSII